VFNIPPDLWAILLQNAPTVFVLILIAIWQEKRLASCNQQMRDMLNKLLDLVVRDEDTNS